MKAMMFTEVIRAEYAGGYRVRLWFNNETVKTVENGADLAPEYLFELPAVE